jgi:cardiolipin synthase
VKLQHFFSLFCTIISLHFAAPVRAAEGDLSFSVSPESAYSLLDESIRSAEKSIELNIYMLTSRAVNEAIVERAAAGVKVTVLLEGEVYGGEMLLPVKNALDEFAAALKEKSGGKARFLVMTGNGDKSKRRFAFNHAKYMIVDGRASFISSENITGSAFALRNFTGGTRGWQIFVESKALAAELGKIFSADSSPKSGDVVSYDQAKFKIKDPGNNPLPPREPRTVNLFPVLRGRLDSASLCLSPKSLECILGFIRGAKNELLVQHMNLPLYWVNRNGGEHKPNPIVHELLAAAKRGVKVKVLLNDDNSFGDKSTGMKEERNDLAVAWLKAEAAKARVRLEAATFAHKAIQVNYVHNKGMVADGRRVFVSSINGTENSVMNNREVAVTVESEQAGKYFGEVFAQDWAASVGL